MTEDPIRWLDDPTLSASLRADLAHGATATVQGLDTTAGLAALRGAITAQTGALAPAAAGGTSFGTKALVGVLVIGSGLGLWKALSTDDASTSTREPVAVIEPAHDEVIEPVAPAAAIPEEAPVVGAAIVPEPPVAEVVPVAPTKRDDRSDRRRDGVKPAAVTPDAPTSDDRYIQEATLVARARKSLASDPARTLALTDQIASEFPSGQLVEERRALAIRALAKLDRLDEAKERATDFLADYAKGPHAAAVRRAIGDTPKD